MREDDETFVAIGQQSASLLRQHGLNPDDVVLDVGSGYGRLAYGLLAESSFRGHYEGFDLLPKHVAWCVESITKTDTRFRFTHLDVANPRYNPTGSIAPSEVVFPYPDDSFDFCALFSVFTHMHSAGIARYISEIARVTRIGGVCLATFFLYNQGRLPTVQSSNCAMPMRHRLDDVSLYFSEADPLHAICYDESYATGLWTAAGFSVLHRHWGSWAGTPWNSAQPPSNRSYQDFLVLALATG